MIEPIQYVAIYIPILIFTSIIIIVFNLKKKIMNEHVHVFNGLIHSTFSCVFTLTTAIILIDYFEIANVVPQMLMRLFFISAELYVYFAGLYFYLLLQQIDETTSTKNLNKYNNTKRISSFALLIVAIIQLFLPVNLKNCLFDGVAEYFALTVYAINFLYWIYLLIKYRKIAKKEKFTRAIVFIAILTTLIFANLLKQSTHIMGLTEFAYVFVIYFLMENPDLKYANELKESKDKTIKALEAKKDFLNSINEEISDPLKNIIKISNEMTKYSNQTNEDIDDDIEYIQKASKNLNEIVGNIIDINKLENNQIKIYEAPYNPTKAITEIANQYKNYYKDSNIELQLEIDDSVPHHLIGDETHVKQIISNLISNAFKYTEKGTINIQASAEKIDSNNYNLKVKVADTGIGIKNETLINLFTNFSKSTNQSNSNITGTGLGLSITKKLIDLLNGNITVESIYGNGSTFTVIIPHKSI